MPVPTLLYYAPEPQPWSGKLPQLCAIQGLRLRAVAPGELDAAVSALARGSVETAHAPDRPLPEALMVFCFLPEHKLDRTLQALRRQRVFCLKAVLTPSNAQWSFRELYEEIDRERKALPQGDRPL